ncbi:unnamed protein product [Acanthoscelides obtectus]|uniref:Uncharacterized protein n=1 Tax=Acanthoscelides obtectus TaxID=200917 RepID=A0A9P0MG07_ACAOB|nr:unnamed protein product [Acanthoscelides obtectus]CAK1652184.1 hypothetical protein AOBTE_LOCUS17723 [Acanthoscelides obtectus]
MCKQIIPPNRVIVTNNLLGSFLESPPAPARKGKRNIERFPFAITSERYQEMFRKKEVLKKQQEEEKENRKRKKQEKRNEKQGKSNNSQTATQCSACLKVIRSGELQSDDYKRYYHQKCVPQSHERNTPSDDDLYIYHSCYRLSDSDQDCEDIDDQEVDELYEQYNQAKKHFTNDYTTLYKTRPINDAFNNYIFFAYVQIIIVSVNSAKLFLNMF